MSLVLLFTVEFLCGFREDYQHSVTTSNCSLKKESYILQVYFSAAFLAFRIYWKGDMQTQSSHQTYSQDRSVVRNAWVRQKFHQVD